MRERIILYLPTGQQGFSPGAPAAAEETELIRQGVGMARRFPMKLKKLEREIFRDGDRGRTNENVKRKT